jgi:GTP-binding protein EngB required for normal cell division
LVIAAAAILVMATLLVLILAATTLAFSVFEYLHDVSPWLLVVYIGLLVTFISAGGIVTWRLLSPREKQQQKNKSTSPVPIADEAKLKETIDQHAAKGIDVDSVVAEIAELEHRRATGELYLAVYGEISHGKSSLIQALVPGAETEIDIRGGTTREVTHYSWQAPSGDRLILADVPGFNQSGDPAQNTAREEALRAHMVIYVCDGDLTRDQWLRLEELSLHGKPIIVAINKKDRYNAADLTRIKQHLQQRLPESTQIVAVQSGGQEQIVRVLADGREEQVKRDRPVMVDELVIAVQNQLMDQGEVLNQLRDNAVFLLATGKLDSALENYRERSSDELVERYTRRAVIGGLAAFAPGSDLIIQGALAVALVRALSNLYETPFRQLDVDQLLKAIGKEGMTKTVPILLAIAGNALKAFPGVGTVIGGLAHAVAYGLLFQSLARALVFTLKTQGKLDPDIALESFKEKLGENLAQRAKQLASIAITEQRKKKR